ncbi:MAG: GNAT family N-acetyltransferase [Bacillota bacterium]
MNGKLVVASNNEKEILRKLMQYYFYDFSEFNGADIQKNGMYGEYPNLDLYWSEKDRYPFIVKCGDKYAGFALVRYMKEGEKQYYSVSEFFVLKKYRRSGLGRMTALLLFERFNGTWEVSQIKNNQPAKMFWRSVIEEYTDGSWTETEVDGMLIQQFSSK